MKFSLLGEWYEFVYAGCQIYAPWLIRVFTMMLQSRSSTEHPVVLDQSLEVADIRHYPELRCRYQSGSWFLL